MKNEIDLDEVAQLVVGRSYINSIDIRKAVFTHKGKIIEVSKEDRDAFRFTGLATIDFAKGLLK